MHKLLLVTHSKDAATLIRAMLEPEGYELEVVDHGSTALRLLYTQPLDGVMLDIYNEEGLSGEDLVRVIRADALLMHIPLILLADVAPEGKRRLENAAIFISRPFNEDNLVRTLRHIFPPKGASTFVSKG